MSKFKNKDIIIFDPPAKYSNVFKNVPREYYEHYKGEIIESETGELYVNCLRENDSTGISFPLNDLEGKFFCQLFKNYDNASDKYSKSKIYGTLGEILPANDKTADDLFLSGAGDWRYPGSHPKGTAYSEDLQLSNSSEKLGSEENQSELNTSYTKALNKERYIYSQSFKSNQWKIKHNLNRYPSVQIIDGEDNRQIDAEIQYNDLNNITILFSKDIKGTAILN